MNGLVDFVYSVTSAIREVQAIVVIVFCAAGIAGVAIASMRIPIKAVSVSIATIGSCILMVPLISSLNDYVDSQVAESAKNRNILEIELQKRKLEDLTRQAQIRQKDKEILDNQVELAKKELENTELNDKVRHLKSAIFNLQGFEKILELGLLKTKLYQVTVNRENLRTVKRIGTFVNENYRDEYLGIISHELEAKFGIDLTLVKVANSKEAPNTIIVSGMASKYLGAMKNIPHTEVSEIRRYEMDPTNIASNEVKSIRIISETDAAQKDDAVTRAAKMEKDYQSKLSQGFETNFMDEAVIGLGESFVKMILAPLGKNILFTKTENSDALPLTEYLQRENSNLDGQEEEITAEAKSLQATIEELDNQRSNIEAHEESAIPSVE